MNKIKDMDSLLNDAYKFSKTATLKDKKTATLGRPKKENKMNEKVWIQLTKEQKEKLTTEADNASMSVATFVRNILNNAKVI